MLNTFFECHAPVSGRYLTIQQLEHWQHDISKSYTEKSCFELCEVSIYVDREYKSYLILSYLILSYLILSYLILSY